VYTTRPSNVRVCLFRHPDMTELYHYDYKVFSSCRQERNGKTKAGQFFYIV
jgi:hypothetical protein